MVDHSFTPLPDDEIEVVLDESSLQAHKAHSHQKRKLVACLLISVFVALFFVIGISISIAVPLGLHLAHRHPPPPHYLNLDDIRQSVEFQIALNPKSDWTNRAPMVRRWVASVSEYSQLLNLTEASGEVDIYVQSHLFTSHCGSSVKTRVREGVTSKSTAIDIKAEDDTKEYTCSSPYWPAEKYYNMSSQKCEMDYHPCFDKYSRGTTITFPEARKFPECGDLAELFPDAFPHVSEHNRHKSVSVHGRRLWWRWRARGEVGLAMHYEVTFTVQYHQSLSCIESGVCPIVDGEWSMRFWADGGEEWEEDVVDDFLATFYRMVQEYDVYEDHSKCAREYFEGKAVGTHRPLFV